MARYLTPEEVKAEHTATLGPELGEAYHALHDEIISLHHKWGEYRELFGARPERIDLVNEASPQFFALIEIVLWEDTLLHIARLTDSERIGKRENLTVRRVPALIADASLRVEVESLVNIALDKSAFARDWRNRHIAHRDLPLALDQGATPLAHASRSAVNDALASLADIVNAIDKHFFETEIAFDHVPGPPGNAIDLLYVIRDGLQAAHAREKRLEDGEFRPEDWERSPAL